MDPRKLEMTVTYADGRKVVFRRCGLLPDVFASEEGELVTFREVNLHKVSGRPVVRYGNTTLMARHLIADAWTPGWDQEYQSVSPRDGNQWNLSVENQQLEKDLKGRPRDSSVYRALLAVELMIATSGDLKAVKEELGMTTNEVDDAIARYAPLHAEAAGRPQALNRIGVRKPFKRYTAPA